jgi:hypothetical protein
VANVNLPLPDARLRLFIQGKEDWLDEGLLCQQEKIKEEELLKKDPPRHKREVHNKTMCHRMGEFRRRQFTTVGHQCKHGGVVQPCPHKIMLCPT